MKNLLTICLCIVLSFPLAQSVRAAEVPDVSSEQAKILEEWNELAQAQAQAGAVDAWSVFYSAFLSGKPDTYPDTYPENYGGGYIEDNLLHINIVNMEQQDLTPYKTALADHLDVVRFMDVDYSCRTLAQAMAPIREEFQSLGVFVVGIALSDSNNAVKILVTPETVHKLPSFITLDVKTMHPALQVPVIVSEEGIPSLLMDGTAAADVAAPTTLPTYVPVVGCALLVLAAAGLLLYKRKQ